MRIIARIQEMASSEILSYIPANVYQDIKDQDPKPTFRAYVVGHEGVSGGKIVGEGELVKRWYASAIQRLYDKLKAGLKIFHGHAATNEHAGRVPIGELVGKALKDIGNKLTAIAIAYIKPEYRSLPLDVASIEAELVIRKDDAGITDTDVGEITGIALGNSAINVPGFPGATLLAQVQAFAKENQRKSLQGGKMKSVDEIKQLVKEEGLSPSDIFGVDVLAEDAVVRGFVKKETRAIVAEREERIEDLGRKFDKRKEELETKLAELNKSLGEKNVEIAKQNVPSLFSKMAKDRKLTDKQAKFIEKRLKRFQPSAPDKLESELAKHLDTELDEFKETAEVLGVAEAVKPPEDKKPGDGGTGPDENKAPGEVLDKYLDPTKNPFIPRI